MMAGRCQEPDVTAIEFTTLTRGFKKQVFISNDSVKTIVEGREQNNGVMSRAITPSQWEELLRSVKDVDIRKLPELQSPTSRRAFDGARHSSLTVTARDGSTYTHNFDDESPHPDLQPLMDLIVRLHDKGR